MFNKSAFDLNAIKYAEYLERTHLPLPYWYQAQITFDQNWRPKEMNTQSMIDSAIDESSGEWSVTLNDAKRSLIAFSVINSDLLLAVFKDLFDENKSLDGRIDRFLFHMDLLLTELNEKKIQLPDHFHTKYIVSIYLTFMYPNIYLPFQYDLFSATMIKLKAIKIPEFYEIDRYYKICRIMTRFLWQDQKIADYYKSKEIIGMGQNQLITYDFMHFCAKSN